MNNYMKTLAIAGIALSLGACQATTMGKMGGGILGAGLGALGGSQFGKGTGKTIATAAGALLGAGGGSTGAFAAFTTFNVLSSNAIGCACDAGLSV